jgi:predicted RNA-binding protein
MFKIFKLDYSYIWPSLKTVYSFLKTRFNWTFAFSLGGFVFGLGGLIISYYSLMNSNEANQSAKVANQLAKEAQLPKINISQVFIPTNSYFNSITMGKFKLLDPINGEESFFTSKEKSDLTFVYGPPLVADDVIILDITNSGGKALSLTDIMDENKDIIVKIGETFSVNYKFVFFGTIQLYDKWANRISNGYPKIEEAYKPKIDFSTPPIKIESGETIRIALGFSSFSCYENGKDRFTHSQEFSHPLNTTIILNFADKTSQSVSIKLKDNLSISPTSPFCK